MRYLISIAAVAFALVLAFTACTPSGNTGGTTTGGNNGTVAPGDGGTPPGETNGTETRTPGTDEEEQPGEGAEKPGDQLTPGASSPGGGAVSSAGLPEGWPAEVTLPPGFTIQTGMTMPESGMAVVANGQMSLDDVAKYYGTIEGWTLVGETNTGGEGGAPPIKVLRYQKADSFLNVQGVIQNDVTVLTLSITQIKTER
jgi:hypothetical protein